MTEANGTRALIGCAATEDGLDVCIEVTARQNAADKAEAMGCPIQAERLRDGARQALDVHLQEAELRARRP